MKNLSKLVEDIKKNPKKEMEKMIPIAVCGVAVTMLGVAFLTAPNIEVNNIQKVELTLTQQECISKNSASYQNTTTGLGRVLKESVQKSCMKL
jgi:hypothetical protein